MRAKACLLILKRDSTIWSRLLQWLCGLSHCRVCLLRRLWHGLGPQTVAPGSCAFLGNRKYQSGLRLLGHIQDQPVKYIWYIWKEHLRCVSRTTTIRVTVKFSLVNMPRRLVMIYLTGRYQRFGPKQLLRLSGIIFVNSDKIQLWQHKVAPYKSKFWVLFGNLGFQKWSRNVCLAL